MEKVRMDCMTSKEIQIVIQEDYPVLLPVGTLEVQGSDGLLGHDALTAEWIAECVAKNSRCLVAPTIPYGYSHFAKGYPGTISLQPHTFYNLLQDILIGLIGQGFSHMLILNNHGLQEPIVGQVCDSIREKYKVLIPSIYPTAVAKDLCSDFYQHGETSFHAGEATLSQLLYLFPEDVNIKDQTIPPMKDFRGFKMANPSAIDFKGSTVNLYLDMGAVAPTGGEGNPFKASKELGQTMLERIVNYISEFITVFRDMDTHI